ncbi:hypothetical protein NDU88_008237 [Pleurodeles waltl]|uniref:Uncharacterized protein n=1 Tax=Pleurodeles waltl TaxID=8319 RepID=A0AAV7RV67_PLEWA|nr:hypothetical protein NDU88_008237 [Pleurodeles waltl]
MSAERHLGTAEESGAANWFRAEMELRRSHPVASRVPLWGKPSRGSTSCSAGTNIETASQKILGVQEPARGARKPFSEAGMLALIPPSEVNKELNEATVDTSGTQEIFHHLAGLEVVDPLPMFDNQARITVSETSALENMLAALTESIKKGFLTSEANQAERRSACESLEIKIDLLAQRNQALEESVEIVREDLIKNKEEIQQLKGTQQELQEKLEYLENNSRRKNVPEGEEGPDLKK